MTVDSQYNLISKLRPGRIILPIILGLGVVLWFIVKDLNIHVMREIVFSWKSVFWLLVAVLFIIIRTLAYMIRIRVLTDRDLTLAQSFRVIILWEFTSAITPSTVGGTGFAVIFLHKEGINVGRSSSVVLATSFLDELYFVVMFPILLLLIGAKAIFITSLEGAGITLMNNLVFVAIAGYVIILLWVLIVGYGLFLNPKVIRKVIINIFMLPVLRRWKGSAIKAGNDIVESSHELSKKSFLFWFKAILLTFITWTTRYWVVNAILLAFFSINNHILIFARQLILWIMMIISPTPGGSGFAEVILGKYISDLIPVEPANVGGVALAMALIWRIISYYPFLIAGVLIIPGWITRKFIKPQTIKK